MAIASLTSAATSNLSTASTETSRSAQASEGVGAIAARVAEAAVEGASATVSFSGQALHALEQAGEFVLDGVQELAVSAWHGLQHGAAGAEHVGEAVAGAVAE